MSPVSLSMVKRLPSRQADNTTVQTGSKVLMMDALLGPIRDMPVKKVRIADTVGINAINNKMTHPGFEIVKTRLLVTVLSKKKATQAARVI